MTGRLCCIEAGLPSLPTLVLLHGFGGNAEVWRDMAQLVKRKAHVLAYDLPGHGGSLDYPNFGSPRIAAMAVAEDLKQRGIVKCHIAGHSMGGAVAALMALQYPQSIASLTLLAPGGFGSQINAEILERFSKAEYDDDVRASFLAMSGPEAALSEAWVKLVLVARQRSGQLAALAHILSKIIRDGKQGQLPLEELAALHIPVHVLWGDRDPVVPVAQLSAASSQFLKMSLPGAGHMLIEECQAEVLKTILKQVG